MIYIDTGAFIAKYITRDQFHEAALAFWDKCEAQKNKLFTSNFVLDETFTLLARRTNYTFAAERVKAIYNSSVIHILRPELDTELNALTDFKKYSDQHVSFTDCISFQLMKKHRIKKAFTFDKHFTLAGFNVIQ